jgi:hypothetical protein
MDREESIQWVKDYLGVGIHPSLALRADSKSAGMSPAMLKAVRVILGVECFRRERYGPFFVCLAGVEHEAGWEPAEKGEVFLTDKDRAVRLMVKVDKLRVSANGSGVKESALGLFEQVEWVADRLLLPMTRLRAEDVPCGSALSLLLWAKSNEDSFRQMYDAKRMERVAQRVVEKPGKGRRVREEAPSQEAIDRLLKRNGGGHEGS